MLISTLWSGIKQQKRVQHWADLNFKTGYLVLLVQRSVRSVLISTLWSGIKQQRRVQHWALSPASFPTSFSFDHCVVDLADWNAQSFESDSIIQMNAVRFIWGSGIAQWLERRTRDRKVAGSNPCWRGGRIFFSRVNFLCWLLFRYPFHPRVTAVARKRPRSICQKRRWQVTAKHAYTLCMWLCMKWHGAWLYGVRRTRRDWLSLAADSCGTSHASAVSTPLRWIFKNAL